MVAGQGPGFTDVVVVVGATEVVVVVGSMVVVDAGAVVVVGSVVVVVVVLSDVVVVVLDPAVVVVESAEVVVVGATDVVVTTVVVVVGAARLTVRAGPVATCVAFGPTRLPVIAFEHAADEICVFAQAIGLGWVDRIKIVAESNGALRIWHAVGDEDDDILGARELRG